MVVQQQKNNSFFQNHLHVVTWNILSRTYTDDDHYSHGQGTGRLESLEQASQRYRLAVTRIMELLPDVLCLQEVDTAFFDRQHNALIDELIADYAVCSMPRQSCPAFPHLRVLLRKGSGLLQRGAAVGFLDRMMQDCGDHTWCGHALAVPVAINGSDLVWIVNIHLSYGAGTLEPTMRMLEEIASTVCREEKLILAGDWNCEVKNLGRLASRVPDLSLVHHSRDGSATCWTPVGSEDDPEWVDKEYTCIDSVFVRGLLPLSKAEVMGLPASPWDHMGEVIEPSDHTPVSVLLTRPLLEVWPTTCSEVSLRFNVADAQSRARRNQSQMHVSLLTFSAIACIAREPALLKVMKHVDESMARALLHPNIASCLGSPFAGYDGCWARRAAARAGMFQTH